MRRIELAVLVAVLLMSGIGHSNVWMTGERLQYITFPPAYENCQMNAAVDFAFFRDKLIPTLSGARTFAGYSLDTALGLAIGGYFFPGSEKVGPALFTAYLGNLLTDIAPSRIGQLWAISATPESLMRQVEQLSNEFGFSDHYLFGISPACGPGYAQYVFPLGAPVNLYITPENQRPIILKLSNPELDYGKVGARVTERNLDGVYRDTTIRKVFGYEYVNGQKIRGPNNQPWSLPIIPGTAQGGGRVTGKIMLAHLPGIGPGGVREIHISSPANQGLMVKRIDDYLLAIVLTRETVLTYGPSYAIDAGNEVKFKVHIKGLHTGARAFATSDGQSQNWDRIADAVFAGTYCQGGGATQTYFQHSPDRLSTVVWCSSAQAGRVDLVMKTVEGDIKIGEATVKEATTKGSPFDILGKVWKIKEGQHLEYSCTFTRIGNTNVFKAKFDWHEDESNKVTITINGLNVTMNRDQAPLPGEKSRRTCTYEGKLYKGAGSTDLNMAKGTIMKCNFKTPENLQWEATILDQRLK